MFALHLHDKLECQFVYSDAEHIQQNWKVSGGRTTDRDGVLANGTHKEL